VVAYAVVTQRFFAAPPGAPPLSLSTLPTFPSLPPTPGLPDSPAPAGPPRGDHATGHPSLPTRLLLLDYGVRLLLIGVAAWWGARWLSAPMRRLTSAAQALGASLGGDTPLPRLDETRGTVEVRETAHVFNDMARRLDDQFKARGLLVAAISHDLRTPLTRMRMRLETLAAEPAAQRCIADVREMDSLIGSVLEVFRGASSGDAVQSTDVAALVQSIVDDLVEQGAAVAVEAGAAIARARPEALRRVLANLLSNALRYGERVDARVWRDGARVHITVDDFGPGIPPDQLDAVFQPFYRVDASRSRHTGGTGLGLYIARDLVARQGGTLTLGNRREGGLRAEVVLPAA